MASHTAAVIALALCAVSDLAATPLLLGSDDVPAAVGVGVAAIAVLTLVAGFGLHRQARWSRPLALGTRAVDILAAVPATAGGAGAGATSAAAVTVVLSIVAIAFLLRSNARTVRTA